MSEYSEYNEESELSERSESSGRGKSSRRSRRVENISGWEAAPRASDVEGDREGGGVYKGCLTCVGRSLTCCLLPCIVCQIGPFKTISEGKAGVLLTFGQLTKTLGPGLHHYNPCTQQVLELPISEQSLNVPRQTVLTTDDVSLEVDAVVFIRVVDVVKALFAVRSYRSAITDLAATTLATVIGATSSDSLFQSREDLNNRIRDSIQGQTNEWGVHVVALEISDVHIPKHMQRVLAAAAEARRDGEAKFITAEAELKAARLYAEAAEALDSDNALLLRYLQTLAEISAENSSTVIIPSGMPNMQSLVGGVASAGVRKHGTRSSRHHAANHSSDSDS